MTQQQENNTISQWRTVEIGEIAQIIGGGTPSTRDASALFIMMEG